MIWDGDPTVGIAGTAHDVAIWRVTGHPTHVISLPDSSTRRRPTVSRSSGTNREIGTIVFTDLHGFSRLRDEQFSTYVGEVLGALGAVIDGHGDAVRWVNTWGDAIAAVFSDVSAAADCRARVPRSARAARSRRDRPSTRPRPAHRRARGAGHGAHRPGEPQEDVLGPRARTHATRIEPRTPEGEVYVTDAFAALLALATGDRCSRPSTSDGSRRRRTSRRFRCTGCAAASRQRASRSRASRSCTSIRPRASATTPFSSPPRSTRFAVDRVVPTSCAKSSCVTPITTGPSPLR